MRESLESVVVVVGAAAAVREVVAARGNLVNAVYRQWHHPALTTY
jgi:hypothetical protein